ncbi:hypothetical protein [uncultured Ramlibacter sp.]|uniref:hypothetical protein n=1 Tax=uncultured Ramlibacter sp. TaxID=260755 RepID=UPI0026034D43|nr:hypothetical protein [uncultured Ramlibacter sp.]
MTKRTLLSTRPALLAAGLCLAFGAGAQQNVKPPKLQLWMDLSTGGMAGMPEMDMPASMGGMFGGRGGPGGGNTSYGQARGMNVMPARVLDIALYNSLKPGAEAAQAVPPGLRMGDKLPLVPPQPQAVPREREPGEMSEDMRRETPKGRILIYWGCGNAVRGGQPRVIDLARANPADMGAAFAGRNAPDRGARVTPQHALFPNEKNRVNVPRDASLVGEHQVLGEGVPASMKFTLAAAQNLMPAIELQSRGGLKDSIALNWAAVPQVRAYFLHAMGQVGNDLVMWSSAENADSGMGLFDYLPNASIDRWLKDNTLLKPETTACAVPKGIFAGPEGAARGDGSPAMLRMIAYGSESNFAHPPRPTDPKIAWEPEWAVRVRVKANTMAMLGEDSSGRGNAASATPGAPSTPGAAAAPAAAPATPLQSAVDAVLPGAGAATGLIKGLFGR